MDDISGIASKYPWLVALLVGGVVFVAWRQSQSDPTTTTTGGMLKSLPVDQGTVAIETNRQNVVSSEISSLASVVLGSQQSSDSLTATLAQASAARDVGLAQVNAQETQAQIAANMQRDIATAQYNADTTRAQTDARMAQTAGQQTKDIARARDNTDIVKTVVDVAGAIIRFFF